MTNIVVNEDLWACSMAPVGIVENWFVADGDAVVERQALVTVRIEDAVHEIGAPASGRVRIAASANAVVEPGSVLGAVLAQA